MKNVKFIIFLVLFSFSCGTDYDDNIKSKTLEANNTIEVISVDSALYNQLELMVDDSINIVTPITCIEFIYPITLSTFNEDTELLNTTSILNNVEFSDFLGALLDTQSISISYPINSTLADNSTFIINNNEELRLSIDACLDQIQIDIIGDCETLIKNCLWKVGYTQDTENTYLGGVFQEENGATTFTFNNVLYFGSWTVFFIEEELHLNISLNNSDEIGEYFNFDWKVEYLDANSIQLINEDKTIVLDQYCNPNYGQCSNFIFSECELQDIPYLAEFILEDYNFCINTILQTEPLYTNIVYFETIDDANNNENAIALDQLYLNTSNSQILYVRIENIEEETYYIIEITIEVQSC